MIKVTSNLMATHSIYENHNDSVLLESFIRNCLFHMTYTILIF